MLPARARYELPRPRFISRNSRVIKHFDPNLSKYPKNDPYREEDYDDSPYRRDDIYVIKLNPTQLSNVKDRSEPELPVKKNYVMKFNAPDEENENRLKINAQSSPGSVESIDLNAWVKLFGNNGLLYLQNLNDDKNSLRSDNTITPGWDALNRVLNRGLEEKLQGKPAPQIYKFSDLVL